MIEICNDQDTQAATKYMTADFCLDDDHKIVIGNVYMTKKFNNRMSKEKQRAVKHFLVENASKLQIKHKSRVELIFHADKSKVEVTFNQKQSKEE